MIPHKKFATLDKELMSEVHLSPCLKTHKIPENQ